MGGVLGVAQLVLSLVPQIIDGVTGAVDAFNSGKELFDKLIEEDRDPTPEEWADLNARIDALQAKLHSDTE